VLLLQPIPIVGCNGDIIMFVCVCPQHGKYILDPVETTFLPISKTVYKSYEMDGLQTGWAMQYSLTHTFRSN